MPQGVGTHPFPQYLVEFVASLDGEELGVGEADGRPAQSGDRRADGDGSGPRSAADLVDTGDDLRSGRGAKGALDGVSRGSYGMAPLAYAARIPSRHPGPLDGPTVPKSSSDRPEAYRSHSPMHTLSACVDTTRTTAEAEAFPALTTRP